MEVNVQYKNNPAVIVRYRLPRHTHRLSSRYAGLFLSAGRQFELKISQIFTKTLPHIYAISPLQTGHGISASVFQFVMPFDEPGPIHDMEVVLNKQGQIGRLIIQAKQAKDKRAQQDDLSVMLADWKDLDAFANFSLEETEEKEDPVPGLRFYEYTETAHALLNDVVASYTRLAFLEKKKSRPDAALLAELESNKLLALSLLKNPETFTSLDRMHEVITDYTPIVKSLFNFAPPFYSAAS